NKKAALRYTVVLAVPLLLCVEAMYSQDDQSQLSLPLQRPATGVVITNTPSFPRPSQDGLYAAPDQTGWQEHGRSMPVERPAYVDVSPDADIEFQDFVTSSLGYGLPIFGQELFRNVPSTFAPLDRVPVTPDYVIGPGDELLIRAWGQIDVNYTAIV